MLSVANFKNDCKLLKFRFEKYNNSENEPAAKQLLASTLRVSSYMATIGFAALAIVSLATLSAPGFLIFGLCAVITHDVYHIAKNWDEKELQPTTGCVKHAGKMLYNGAKAALNNKDPNTAARLSRCRNLTESTFIAKPIVSLASSIIES